MTEREILQFVAAMESACQHEPTPWSSGSIDDREGKRHYFTLMRCKKCGMMNPPEPFVHGEQRKT